MKKIILSLLLFSFCISAFACSQEILNDDGTPKIEPTKEESEVVMTIDGFDVTYDLFRYFCLNHKADYPEGGDALKAAIEASVRNVATVYKVAEKIGLNKVVAAGDVIESVIDVYEQCDRSTRKYKEMLDGMHMTDRTFRTITEVNSLQNEIYVSFPDSGLADTSDEAVSSVLKSDKCIVVKQILIEKTDSRSDGESRKLAETALAEAKSGGDMKHLIEKYSDDLSVKNISEGYYLTEYQFVPEFEEAAFALEVGEVSDIVENDAAFSIIFRCEKDEDYIDSHFDELRQTYLDALYQKTLEGFAAALPNPEYTEFYATLDIDNIK